MFLGETKLISLGFEKKSGDTFVFKRKQWSRRRNRYVKIPIAEVTLDKIGRVVRHKGFPVDKNGNPDIHFIRIDR